MTVIDNNTATTEQKQTIKAIKAEIRNYFSDHATAVGQLSNQVFYAPTHHYYTGKNYCDIFFSEVAQDFPEIVNHETLDALTAHLKAKLSEYSEADSIEKVVKINVKAQAKALANNTLYLPKRLLTIRVNFVEADDDGVSGTDVINYELVDTSEFDELAPVLNPVPQVKRVFDPRTLLN